MLKAIRTEDCIEANGDSFHEFEINTSSQKASFQQVYPLKNVFCYTICVPCVTFIVESISTLHSKRSCCR